MRYHTYLSIYYIIHHRYRMISIHILYYMYIYIYIYYYIYILLYIYYYIYILLYIYTGYTKDTVWLSSCKELFWLWNLTLFRPFFTLRPCGLFHSAAERRVTWCRTNDLGDQLQWLHPTDEISPHLVAWKPDEDIQISRFFGRSINFIGAWINSVFWCAHKTLMFNDV